MSVEPLFNQAVALQESGRLAEAVRVYDLVLQRNPEHAQALCNLGLIAHQWGELAMAESLLTRAVTADPAHADAWNILGVITRSLGRLAESCTQFTRAIEIEPGFAHAHVNLGGTLLGLGDIPRAEDLLERACTLDPTLADAHFIRGLLLRAKGQLALAQEAFLRAIHLDPGLAPGFHNLGLVQKEQGQLSAAAESYGRALQLAPDQAETHGNLGGVLRLLGDLQQAAFHFERAVALAPDHAHGHLNLGNVLLEGGNLPEALTQLKQSLALDPHLAEAHLGLANALHDQGEGVQALAHLEQAMGPHMEEARLFHLHLKQSLCDWRDFEQVADGALQMVRQGRGKICPAPLQLLSLPGASALDARNLAERFCRERFSALAAMGRAGSPPPLADGKLCVGYLSADFRNHPVGHLFAEVVELHDRGHFRVLGFSHGPDDGSSLRRRYQQGFDRFFDISRLSTPQAAALIQEQGVHLLVDLTGLTNHSRTDIAALRPAPIQINYLGYPGSSGATFMDYIIGDRWVTPLAQAHHFCEKIAQLPHNYQANDRKRPLGTPHAKDHYGLPADGVIFCCFNHVNKITPALFSLWCRLLQEVEGSCLWLLATRPAVMDNLAQQAHLRGVDPKRLVFAGMLPLEEHLARVSLADLFLDTLPYNAHTTASDALWAGVPLVTCMGEAFQSRVAASLLHGVGLPELITTSLHDYETLALSLARHPERLADLKDRLISGRLAHPLFDSRATTCALEGLYRRMWERCLAGMPADHLPAQVPLI